MKSGSRKKVFYDYAYLEYRRSWSMQGKEASYYSFKSNRNKLFDVSKFVKKRKKHFQELVEKNEYFRLLCVSIQSIKIFYLH